MEAKASPQLHFFFALLHFSRRSFYFLLKTEMKNYFILSTFSVHHHDISRVLTNPALLQLRIWYERFKPTFGTRTQTFRALFCWNEKSFLLKFFLCLLWLYNLNRFSVKCRRDFWSVSRRKPSDRPIVALLGLNRWWIKTHDRKSNRWRKGKHL